MPQVNPEQEQLLQTVVRGYYINYHDKSNGVYIISPEYEINVTVLQIKTL